jgi:PAS domain S-box-containing protein
MNYKDKPKVELIKELEELNQRYNTLNDSYTKDIRERNKAKEAFKSEQYLMNALMNNALDQIYFKDTESRFILINNVQAKALGLANPEMAVGKTDFDFFSHEHAQQAFDDEKEIIRTGQPIIKEEKETWPDGRISWVSTSKFPLHDRDEKIIGTFGISVNISKRRQVEEALRNSEKNFRELFEANTDGITIFAINPLGPPNKVLDLNENAAKMMGFTKDEMLHMNPRDFEYTPTLEQVEKRKNDLQNFGMTNFETTIKHKLGYDIHLEIKIKVVNYNNQPALMNIARDITDRKKSEIQLKQYASELSKLNTDKDRFISILAHDLKSPFNSILGFLDLLTINIRKYDINKIEQQINFVHKSARQTFNLLEDILMWVGSQSGKLPFEPQELNLKDVCCSLIPDMIPIAEAKHIKINHSVLDEINVFADIDMFRTIMRNLISNAIKFTNMGGEIIISAEFAEADLLLKVSDNGIGIKPENLPKLFDMSQSRSTKGTADEKGTGLGLVLCKDFVEKHGGKIWAESQPGKGSTFKFTIPCNNKQFKTV